MAEKHLGWVDVGMALLAGGFIAIAIFFRNEDYIVPLLLGYTVITVIWAAVAEWAAMREEALVGAAGRPAAQAKEPLAH